MAIYWSRQEFSTAVHELGHMAAAINYGAIPIFVDIHARGGLAEWSWDTHAPTPKMLITIAAAGFLAERELLKRYEPIDGASDEELIEKLRDGFTAAEIDACRSTAGAIVRMRRQWILSRARQMTEHRKYLFDNNGDLRRKVIR
jgi:hypothetical protein